MLIYLCVQIRFRYLIAKYFFSIFKKAGLFGLLHWFLFQNFALGPISY